MFGRIIRYIKIHLINNPRYFFTYALHYYDPGYTFKVNFYTGDEMKELLVKRRSIIRIGDGEVYLMNRGGISFQEYDPAIRQAFFSMIREYDNRSTYVLGYNKIPLESPNQKMRTVNLLHSWLPLKVYYDLYFSKEMRYVDASLFYYNDTIPKCFEEFLLTQHLVLVSKESNLELFKNNPRIPFSDVSFVVTPETNAYREKQRIHEAINAAVATNGKERTVVVMACGPAGKVIGYQLVKDGVMVLDLGLGIEVAYSDTKIDYIANPFLVRK